MAEARTTLFSHMHGLLLGGSEKGSALSAFAATGGHGPDSAAWWEHLFLLRVESATLAAKLAALGTPLSAEHQAVLRLIFGRASAALQDPHPHRVANACLTLEILFDHVLAERRLPYVAAVAAICGAGEADAFFATLFARLHRILSAPVPPEAPREAKPAVLRGAALQALLAVATAEANISANPILARVVEARFSVSEGPDDARKAAAEEEAYRAAAAQFGGTAQRDGAPAAGGEVGGRTTGFFDAALAAIALGQAAAGTMEGPTAPLGSARVHAALSLQSVRLRPIKFAVEIRSKELSNFWDVFAAGRGAAGGSRGALPAWGVRQPVPCGRGAAGAHRRVTGDPSPFRLGCRTKAGVLPSWSSRRRFLALGCGLRPVGTVSARR